MTKVSNEEQSNNANVLLSAGGTSTDNVPMKYKTFFFLIFLAGILLLITLFGSSVTIP